jgi:hypothetical protein
MVKGAGPVYAEVRSKWHLQLTFQEVIQSKSLVTSCWKNFVKV